MRKRVNKSGPGLAQLARFLQYPQQSQLPENRRMPCLVALFALLTPRIVVLVLWFFTGWFERVFDTLMWPLLGFIFLPTTLLWYSAVHNWWGGEWSMVPVIGLVVSLLIDLSPGSAKRD
jgi:hypothetical protein